jgi:hypothetical protein
MSRIVLRLPVVVLAAVLITAVVTGQTASTLEKTQTIALKGPPGKRLDHVALDAKRDRLYVANQANASLDVIDLKQGKVLKTVPDQSEIQGVTYVPELDRVFATLGTGSLHVFDGDATKLLKTIKIPEADNCRFDPRSGQIYVAAIADKKDRKLAIVDAKALEAKGEIKLPSAAEAFVLEKDRPRLYVNTPAPHQVLVIDTDKKEVLKKHAVSEAGNFPLALDEANRRLFVGCRKEPKLLVLDTESGKEIAAVPIPNDVDDIYYDAKRKRLFASCGEGFIVVIAQKDKDRYEVQEKLPTVKMARTCLYDADSGRLFVPIPGQSEKVGPEVRVFKVKP